VRRFAPGSDWLYAKLYCGPATADRVLLEVAEPVVRAALASGAADRWFFVRYSDPDRHLRLRLHGDARRLMAEVLPLLGEAAAPYLHDGRVARLQLDTYVPEVERYGGPPALGLAEQLFMLDSQAALRIVEATLDDAGRNLRWQLAVCGIDLLLASFGLSEAERAGWSLAWRDHLTRDARLAGQAVPSQKQLGLEYRRYRAALECLLAQAHSGEIAAGPASDPLAALRGRSERLAPITARLRELDHAGCLGLSLAELAASYVHMHLNRVFRSHHAIQERVLSDVLARLYLRGAARQDAPSISKGAVL
jgi:thiopeptide-type bacteriocin biosynthesis protein